jgi:hypothetical protein
MKKIYFYSHIVDTSALFLELNEMDLTSIERLHLISLIDSNIHQEVIALILSELNLPDRKIFLAHLASESHDKIWKLLNSKINDAEEKIKKTVETLKEELHKDMQKVKGI